MTTTSKDPTPPRVPETARQGGEANGRWAFAEPAVWTSRMLAALENGVKGGVWFSLMDKVYAPGNLLAAWKHVWRNHGAAGIDRQTVQQYGARILSNLKGLHEQLRDGTYRPAAIRRHWIPKPGVQAKRPLGIPTVTDRVVQGALRNAIEPIFERRFTEHSYGFRPGRGCKDALRRVDELLKAGFTQVVDADIESYFDNIDHDLLMHEVRKEIGDGSVLTLIQAYLGQRVMEGVKDWKPTTGTPQGAVISPLLANIFLHPVDIAIQSAGFEMVRYADDVVILCREKEQAHQALALLDALMAARRLKLHPTKTRIVDATQPGGFDFLGYHFEQGRKTPRSKSMAKLRDRVRELTPRGSGSAMAAIVERLNASLRGWFEYFKHCFRKTFDVVDSFVRRRLRAILVRRYKKGQPKKHGTGNAHTIWPNAYFAKQGLFSLAKAHAAARQSRY